MKKIIGICIILMLSTMHLSLKAQVVVGGDKSPEEFSALELISTKGGLRHPQMTTAQRDALLNGIADKSKAQGLTVFNTDINCIEFFKDESSGWINLCDALNIAEVPLGVEATLRAYTVVDGSVTTGSHGKQKFDVAQVNTGGTCGTLSAEAGRGGDFKIATDYTRNYVVDFSSIAEVSNLMVGKYQDPYGIIELVSGDVEGALSNTKNQVLVKFVSDINTKAKGTREHNALKATLYAIYSKDGLLKRVEYTITVMDCLGCGVRVSADQSWLPVMCYNIGADETKNPFTYSTPIEGDSYQWGRKADGHEKITANIFYPMIPLGKLDYPTVPLDELDADGTIKTTSPRYGLFIPSLSNCKEHFFFDWSAQHNKTIWGDGTQRLIVRKGTTDPCPKGFRLPTHLETEQISGELELNASLKGAKAKSGSTLFLPYSPYRDRKGTVSTTLDGNYWTSSPYKPGSGTDEAQVWALDLDPTGSNITVTQVSRSYSGSVRCVVE